MAFPSYFYNNTQPSFGRHFPLFDNFDKGPRQSPRKVAPPPRWEPEFHVRETIQGYELRGDFSGVDKDDVRINFVDPQTMLIHGKAKRNSPSAPAENQMTANNDTTTPSEAPAKPEKKKLYQATVEDVEDEGEPGTTTYKPRKAGSETAAATPKKYTEAPKPQPRPQPAQRTPVAKPKPSPTEEPAREFSRSFRFPVRIDHSGVTAKFKDGILAISVPKARRQQFPFASMF